jgi:hypothetical protein
MTAPRRSASIGEWRTHRPDGIIALQEQREEARAVLQRCRNKRGSAASLGDGAKIWMWDVVAVIEVINEVKGLFP